MSHPKTCPVLNVNAHVNPAYAARFPKGELMDASFDAAQSRLPSQEAHRNASTTLSHVGIGVPVPVPSMFPGLALGRSQARRIWNGMSGD